MRNELSISISQNHKIDKKAIADLYDRKISSSSDFNVQLAKEDLITCNHNGIFMPGDSLESYKALATDPKSRLSIIHHLELNTTRFGLLFLKTPTKEMTVLDAGCGGGGSSMLIHKTYGSKVEGFTLSAKQAEFATLAAQHYGCADKVSFAVDDMMHLKKTDNSFDRIWACESTEHAPSLDELFQEFARVAKNNARLVIIAWCARDAQVKNLIDAHYQTDIKPAGSYLASAEKFGWRLAYHHDLTDQTAPYWQLRSYPNECTGSERFMTPGFASHDVQYHMFCFDLEK